MGWSRRTVNPSGQPYAGWNAAPFTIGRNHRLPLVVEHALANVTDMTSPFHNTLAKELAALNSAPADPAALEAWLECTDQLAIVDGQAATEEIILYAVGVRTFIHSVGVAVEQLDAAKPEELLQWSGDAYAPETVLNWSTDGEVWLEDGGLVTVWQEIDDVQRFVFGREFSDRWSGRFKYEILQSLVHTLDLHEVVERRAFCKLDQNGDYDDVISITYGDAYRDEISLVTIKRDALEAYLLLDRLGLVQMFDFTLTSPGAFRDWSQDREERIVSRAGCAYRQHVDPGNGSYTRGIRFHHSDLTERELWARLSGGREPPIEHQVFVAHDFRNKRVTGISTAPQATTNYFEAQTNDLPFELSPAFFRPEVLLKYKTDRDKYRIEGRTIRCRGGWALRSFDINSAGQVHTYICDLRGLPNTELLHWKAHNVEPEAPIAKRAHQADFLGEWSSDPDPIGGLAEMLRTWDRSSVPWWSLRDPQLLAQIGPPVTTSRDEWAGAFRDLSQLVAEGLEKKCLAGILRVQNVPFEKQFGSIKLAELLWQHAEPDDGEQRLSALRECVEVRNKTGAHAAPADAARLAADAIEKYESFMAHFEDACHRITEELGVIEALCRKYG